MAILFSWPLCLLCFERRVFYGRTWIRSDLHGRIGIGMLKKWIPLMIIAIGLAGFLLSGLPKYFTFQSLKAHEKLIMLFISAHPILSPLIYMAFYTLTVIFLLPVRVVVSIAGGFFFANPLSTIYSLISYTTGSCIVFLLAKGPCRDLFLKKAGPGLKKLEKNFKKNSVNYLLFLRILPITPPGFATFGFAFLGERLWTFAWTTFVGRIPMMIIFSAVGSKLGDIFRSGEEVTIATFFNWWMILLILIPAVLTLLPIILKKKTN